jgi:hypothetical protein
VLIPDTESAHSRHNKSFFCKKSINSLTQIYFSGYLHGQIVFAGIGLCDSCVAVVVIEESFLHHVLELLGDLQVAFVGDHANDGHPQSLVTDYVVVLLIVVLVVLLKTQRFKMFLVDSHMIHLSLFNNKWISTTKENTRNMEQNLFSTLNQHSLL